VISESEIKSEIFLNEYTSKPLAKLDIGLVINFQSPNGRGALRREIDICVGTVGMKGFFY
jgi:hypothetical protein